MFVYKSLRGGDEDDDDGGCRSTRSIRQVFGENFVDLFLDHLWWRFDSIPESKYTLTRKRLLQQTVVLRHAEERSRIFKNVHTHNIAFTFSLLLHNHTPKQSHTLYLSLFLTHLGTQTHVHSLFLNICLKPSVLFLSLSGSLKRRFLPAHKHAFLANGYLTRATNP